ncbi:MAG: flagellar hook-associated protein FlgL [Nitrospiraceae bacterium]
MRVADQQLFGLLQGRFQQISRRIFDAQQQITSQKRVSKPSDDPSTFGQIISGKSDLARAEQRIRNIEFATTRLDGADNTLGTVSNLLSRIKELAVRARSDTATAADRGLIAKEVRQLHRQLVHLANTEVNGSSLFAGTKTDVAPFVLGSGDDVQYQGNGETQSVEVGNNQRIQVTVPGDQIFTGATTNVFDNVENLLAALESNNGSGIEAGIGDVDLSIIQIAGAQGTIGAMANQLESTKRSLQDVNDLIKTALSRNEDTDLAKAVSELTGQQLALEATARSANGLFENSLLKFLK